MKLLPTQIVDSNSMALNGHALNYSKPGTGKTLTAINTCELVGIKSGVVVAPPIALTMWGEVLTEQLGVKVSVLRSGGAPIMGESAWVVTTYALASGPQWEALYAHAHDNLDNTALILDEAHSVKSRSSKRTKGIFGEDYNGRGGLCEVFDRVYSLTGTPILRHNDDLWTQLRYTKPEVLAQYGVLTYERFVAQYCHMQVRQFHPRQRPQRVVTGSKNQEELNMLLKDCGMIRRTVEEVAEFMPPITIRNLDLGKGPIKVPKLTEAQIMAGLAKEDEALMKVWREMGMAKVDDAVDYIEEAALQGPVLVGYWFTDTGKALETKLHRDLTVARVSGATSAVERDKIEKAFNSGAIDVLVGQMSAMNTSWNLQKTSSHVIIVEDHFSGAVVEQFYKRVYRMGQGNHTQLDFLKYSNPLDKAISRLRAQKDESAAKVLGS
jgi:SNF2 family DNA or RNA helicase